MPEILLGAFIVIGVVVVAILCAITVRRSFTVEVLAAGNDVAGFIYAVVGVVYAVLLAFAVVVVWEEYHEAEDNVAQEANQVSDIYRDAAVLSDSVRLPIQKELREYARAVVEDEWGLLPEGKRSTRAERAYLRLWEMIRVIQPTSERETIWLAEMVGRLNDLGDYRRLRILGSHTSVPGHMWVLLIAGGVIAVGFSLLFGTPYLSSHLLMVGALTGVVTFTLYLIAALDHPFEGAIHISAEAFEHIIPLLK